MPKLLVIDDEPEILEMIRAHFSVRGYEVLSALDGEEGLELLESKRPDAILLDLKMEKLDGDRFLEEARARKHDVKVLVITGYTDEALQRKLERLGASAVLEKPASILEIERRVEELVKEKDTP